MRDPQNLFEVNPDVHVPAGIPLVAGLTGYSDPGSAVAEMTNHLRSNLERTSVATFDTDELFDYRARRPVMIFTETHLTEYHPARLGLELTHDDMGQPFLLLSGYEPDFQWERFVAAVLHLIGTFGVTSVTWLNAIPMPVPHTRPIGVTVSGNRPELTEALSAWRPTTQLPANVLHLVEYRLQELGHPTAGLVLLIPHYLSDTEYPDASVAALDALTAATGLMFPTDSLREQGRTFLTRIDAQIAENVELAKLVESLEQRYDSFMEGNTLRSAFADADGELPSAESIAAEFEKFLATRTPRDGETPIG